MRLKIPYWPILLGPLALGYLGGLLNIIATASNHEQMPVLFPGGCFEGLFADDLRHVCMTSATHLKIVCDWILVGTKLKSPGDFLIGFYEEFESVSLYLWIALIVKDYNNGHLRASWK